MAQLASSCVRSIGNLELVLNPKQKGCLGIRADSKFPMPAAHRFFEPVPPGENVSRGESGVRHFVISELAGLRADSRMKIHSGQFRNSEVPDPDLRVVPDPQSGRFVEEHLRSRLRAMDRSQLSSGDREDSGHEAFSTCGRRKVVQKS